ncbi:MAG TPA: YiiX family permuted papain-like enzyme [Bacteroidales bacterium]|nr:YiiX family permuted papain-like enzyme [Bacteroidales bacterium]HQA86674.1 YiiX family permuted papain-like enzyme [Bacteroidales bacterium]
MVTKNRVFISILVLILGVIILFGVYTKRKFYDPKHRLENAKKEVRQLAKNDAIQNGDLIFQTSLSGQSKAIQLATNSKYSHCGIIFIDNDEYYVFEAIQPVKSTQLDKWIARGKDGHYVIKRLKNADQVLNSETLKKMKQEGEKFKGKNYDLTFEWSDDKIYCSELIWKIYQRATGIEIGQLQKLGDFDLTSEEVKEKLKERYGDNIATDEIVISPIAIFNSELLKTVKSN